LLALNIFIHKEDFFQITDKREEIAREEKWINLRYSHRRVKRNVLDRKRARNGNVTGVINLASRANSDTMIRTVARRTAT